MFDPKNNPCITTGTVKFRFTKMSYSEYLRSKLQEKGWTAAELARRSGVTKQNLGRILNDVPHWQTGKAPRASEDFVDATAKALEIDIDEARLAAGYAPRGNASEMIDIGDGVTIRFHGSKDWDDEQRSRAVEAVKTVIAGIKARNQ